MRTIPWPLEPDEIDVLLERMRFVHGKWDIYHRGQRNVLADAIVLSRAEHDQLVATARSVWLALRELEAAVITDPRALLAIGIPEALVSTIRSPVPDAPRITRCDFHLAVGGQWMITEFNEDGPGGFVEATALNAALAQTCGERLAEFEFAGDLRQAVIDAMAPWQRIGLIYATGYTEDLQQVALIADWLESAGRHPVMASPANLVVENEQAFLFGEPVEALYRYYPGEWLADLPNVDTWQDACAWLPMINPLPALVAQSKRFYAAAAEHGLDLAEEAGHVIGQHMPPSHYLHRASREQLLAERERWVIKGAFGRMGDTVRLGIGSSPEQWAQALDQALASDEPFAIQERFDAVPLWFSSGLGYATIGLYLINGQFAGYYSRVSPYPVINYDSSHVPTLVEVS
jgi:glutathionylspermidine synthase